MTNEITSFAPGSGARVRPRSRLASESRLDLSGTWRFHFSECPELAPEGSAASDFDDTSWDEIEVPAHWVLQGRPEWGQPCYTNVNFPFPVEPPFVPDVNPTGDYRLSFAVAADFLPEGGRVVLRFGGIESLGIVSLNGEQVGVIRGSRLQQELDVSAQLVAGENLLHVRVHQWSSASYLEDQDQWWLPGIFREVELLVRPAGGIDDLWLQADFTPGTDRGTIIPELRCGADAFPVTIRIPELGLEQVFAEAAEVRGFQVSGIEPWSADQPRLYQVEVAAAGEQVSLRLGFRRVKIVGHEWRVNGHKLRIRGVNRHEFHPDRGRVFDREYARAGLLQMKQHNINAIRTAHYPPHPELLELTDELGFWVIDECDLETHGFEFEGWLDNPSDDPRWREALLDRVERFFERDKNHPSVVCWSLGNESGTGRNLAAMAGWLHQRDPGRPVHYEGDYEGAYTDLVSRMYAPVEEMEEMSFGTGQKDVGTSPGRNALLAARPMILCEYAHAMGNGAGGLQEYEDRFENLPQWHGGFVWEWRDHGLRTKTAEGVEYFGYGGDFGEDFHDGSFVCDGMTLADGTPTPMLAEFAAVVSPIKLNLRVAPFENPGGVLEVVNLRHDGDTSDLRYLVVDELDGRVVADFEVELRPVSPVRDLFELGLAEEEFAELEDNELGGLYDLNECPLPAPGQAGEGELIRTVRAVLAKDTPWAPAGHVIASTQATLELSQPMPGYRRWESPSVSDSVITLGPASFAASTGDLTQLGDLKLVGPWLELFRAPTENDSLGFFPSYVDVAPADSRGRGAPGPSSEAQWRAAGLDRLQRRVISVERTESGLRVLHRYGPVASQRCVTLELLWGWDGESLSLTGNAVPSRDWTGTWPRIGLHFELPLELSEVEWFGAGPNENYPDSQQAAMLGRFRSRIEDLVVNYAVPQESGHRGGLRELLLPEIGLELRATGRAPLPGFTLRRHDVAEVAAAAHPHELPAPRATHLWLDAAQHGLGSRSCGPDVRTEYQLRPRAAAWSLEWKVSRAG